MTTVETLDILIRAQTKQAEQRFARLRNVFGAAFSALAVSQVLSSIGQQLDTIADKIDNVTKSAVRLGIGVDNLLQLQRAAEFANVSARDMEMAIQRMTRRVAEAAQGLGEAQGALRDLNLTAAELNQLQPDRQFRAIMRALDEIPNANDRLRMAFKIFDSEGTRVLQLLDDGFAGFQDKMEKAASTIPANMEEISNRVAAANDRITESQQRLESQNLEVAASYREIQAAYQAWMTAAVGRTKVAETEMVRLNKLAIDFQNTTREGGLQSFLRGGGPRVIGQAEQGAQRAVQRAAEALETDLPQAMLRVENELGRRFFNLGGMVAEGMARAMPQMGAALRGLGQEAEAIIEPIQKALEPIRNFDRPGAASRGSLEAFESAQKAQDNQERLARRQRDKTNKLLEENNRLLRNINQAPSDGLDVNPFQLNRR